ncbi:hypothetical protein P153DRAFT_371924 [Dothidotthia symphoricarpi CBS 119687]|uniref:Uncharacterized protein n=1 Tax=Dothidotthia symphoricarpi CBS 119687 TaxID=1392245 RepID=A0A6A6AUM3_9PLEO|nr:uncharacterized protein P153DRAFT_371924 [Dothidotthia symphoricarpi CBS 119687]KAF2134567.1 hypothetical protein P153DRAFT_371924 [Dothidotthia symphoricarpi CBS 119687]
MSQSIAIPKRTKKELSHGSAGSSGSSPGSFAAYGSFGASSVSSTPAGSPSQEGKMRRQSLMSESFSRAEHTVINVGDAESPRLITCVKASQGFDWNQEIFLPSYADYHFDDLECRQDPVQDIVLTDEEAKNMFPS